MSTASAPPDVMRIAMPSSDAWSDALAFPVPEAPPASFVVELPHFNGPLDLLLTLLREEEVDIYDIPIARVAEQFLARIQSLRLDEAADYLEMAARLLRIKAQMLLPRREGDEAWDDPRAELVRHLLEYQQVREVVDVLERRAEARRNRFARTPIQTSESMVELVARPATFTAAMADLFAAIDRVVRIARAPDVHSIVPRALDVPGALETVRSLLARRARLQWRDLVPDGAESWEILSMLLAVLELARLGECVLRQRAPFGTVTIAATDQSARSARADGATASADADPALAPLVTNEVGNDAPGAAA